MTRAVAILAISLLALPVMAQRGIGGVARGGGGGFPGGGGARGGGFPGGGGYQGGGGGGMNRGGGVTITRPPLVGNPGGNLGPTPFSNGTYGSYVNGFGSVVFPSGIRSYGSVVNPAGVGTINGVGVNGYYGGYYGNYGTGLVGGNRTAIYPVPVFVGGGYGYGYNNGYQDPTQVTVINQQPPAVIINQGYQPDPPAHPSMQVYGNGADPAVNSIQVPSPSNPEGRPLSVASQGNQTDQFNPNDDPTIYLIALKDGTIYASYAYWTERDVLHYITPGHIQNQVSLDQVDVPLSRRLNRDRKLEFDLK